jgi:Flp pilus assembly protein TadD
VGLASVQARQGQVQASEATLERSLQQQPKDAAVLTLLGTSYAHRGEMARAREVFEKALKINPRHPAAANNLAWIYSEHGGDAEEALRLATLAKEVAPDDPHVSDTLGWILYKRGIHQRAASLLREAATRLPSDPLVQYHLGMALLKIEDRGAARQALDRALKLDASFKHAEEARKALASL